MKYKIKVWKVLSKNDTGETGAHQAGMSITKSIAKSGIFPIMPTDILNPKVEIQFKDEYLKKWCFIYTYYNDKYFGKSSSKSHDEYRLTRINKFFNEYKICAGDEIWFGINELDEYVVGFNKQHNENNDGVIHIQKGWKFIKF